MDELEVKAVLNILVERTSNHSCKVSKRYFIATVEKRRLRRCIRTQHSRMCQRMTFRPKLWLTVHKKGRRRQIPSSSFVLHGKWRWNSHWYVIYWCSTNLLQTCYKPAKNGALFQICSKFIRSKYCYKPATNANLLFYVFSSHLGDQTFVKLQKLLCLIPASRT